MTEASDTEPGRPRKRRTPKTEGEAPTPKKKAAPRKPRAKKVDPILLEEPPEVVETLEADPVIPKRSFKRRISWLTFKYSVISFAAFVLFSTLWIIFYRFVNPPVTPLMVLRHFQEEEDLRKRWRNYEEISPDFLLAVVAAEDQLFFQHNGFDLKQIQAAIDERLKGGRLRGGSTISQQVAKNAFLWPGRSWIRKGLEAWFTVGIELLWSKERILEVYVNVAEMGRGIYGVESAAQHYYQKAASDLTRSECALLATVLPDPRDRSPLKATGSMRERQGWILGQMRNLGAIDSLAERSLGGE